MIFIHDKQQRIGSSYLKLKGNCVTPRVVYGILVQLVRMHACHA